MPNQVMPSSENAPPVAPLHPWVWPAKPLQRVHVDYAGPFMGRQFLIVVGAHSKWPEVIEMKTTTSSATILELRRLFSSYGLPEQLVSDNGPQFTSTEFEKFLKSNGIKHTCSAPYHPSSNGLAERFVQTFKRAMKASEHPELSSHQQLMGFLLSYRTIPHATTQVAPASLFLQRHARTRFDLLRPEVEDIVSSSQSVQKQNFDKHCRQRDFFVGPRVMVRNLRPGPRWVPGTLIERKGPLTYLVQVSEGRIWKRHVDHLHKTTDTQQDHTSFVVPTADPAEVEQLQLSNFHWMLALVHHPQILRNLPQKLNLTQQQIFQRWKPVRFHWRFHQPLLRLHHLLSDDTPKNAETTEQISLINLEGKENVEFETMYFNYIYPYLVLWPTGGLIAVEQLIVHAQYI